MGGLRENIAVVADPKRSTYGAAFLANDTGGYDTFGDGTPTEELFVRWLQFSSLNTLTTFFSFAASPTRNHPYAYSPDAQAVARQYLHLRMRLFPYLYTAALDTRLTGRKPVQGDGVHEYQYLLGPALLVAPVFTPSTVTREVFLPEGRWYDWDTDRVYEGNRTVTVDAPLEKLPLFVRAGALVPLRDYASSIAAGTNARLTLEAWPGPAASSYTLREDDGTSNDYLDGGFASTGLNLAARDGRTTLEILPVQGKYAGMAPERQWTVRLHDQPAPKAVRLDGRPLEFTYDAAERVVTVGFTAAKAKGCRLVFEQ
jgi:alpha-glucosidase